VQDQLQKMIEANQIRHVISTTSGTRTWDVKELVVPGINIELSHDTPLPIKLLYATPHTLGRDRIASACGAHFLYPDQHLLVVDAGTCLTLNMVLASGIFLGGNIAPGLTMRLQAMHEKTAGLPLADAGWPDTFIGDSTLHALQLGAGLGMVMEIEGFISRAKDAFGEVSVVMTGGDSAYLADKVECQIFVEPELVMKGLFKILSFNVQ
jgi:type III pantothenate kinase